LPPNPRGAGAPPPPLLAPVLLSITPAQAAPDHWPQFWGVQVEQLEYRLGDDTDVFAWDFDAFAGTDERRFVWRSEAEYATDEDAFEQLENQARVTQPISEFFDLAYGLRLDTPEGATRLHGLIGIQGLAPQWFEIDATLFVSDTPFLRFETEYEALITNRLNLVPSLELTLPMVDDEGIGAGAWGPKLEAGLRLGYDLIGRSFTPYIGVHYERLFGQTADYARDDGEERDALFFVVGARLLF
jgi:copper resistance protein B